MTNNIQTKRKLIFEFHNPIYSQAKIDILRANDVKTIFVITSDDPKITAAMVNQFEESGFKVKVIAVTNLNEDKLPEIKKSVAEIDKSFKEGNCHIVSYKDKYSGSVIACYYRYIGKTLDDAIKRVRKIRKDIELEPKEIKFIHNFDHYMKVIESGGDESLDVNSLALDKPSVDLDIPEIRLSEPVVEEERKPTEPDLFDEKKIELKENDIKDENLQQPIEDDISKDKIEIETPEPQESKEIIAQDAPVVSKHKIIDDETEEEIFIPAQKGSFRKFISSLQFKLLVIISLIVAASLTGMILYATGSFMNRTENDEREYILEKSNLISMQVEATFVTTIEKARTMAISMVESIDNNFYKKILRDEKNILYFSIGRSEGNTLRIIKEAYNGKEINNNSLYQSIPLSIKKNNKEFKASLRGDTVVINESPALGAPMLAISIPLQKNNYSGSIVIIYVKMDRFLEAFTVKGKEYLNVFMVRENGDVIAHKDPSMVLSGSNLTDIPIVKSMSSSSQKNKSEPFVSKKGISMLGSFNKISYGHLAVIATVNKEKALEEVYTIRRRNLYLMAIVLAGAFLFVYFFSKTITQPIIKLVRATEQIKAGNYHVNIRATTKDEIGDLTQSFVEMGKGLEEREKMKDAFGKFVNEEIAQQVMKGEIHLGGERKTAAIFFSDIRSFTAISEKLEPEEVVEFLNEYMTLMVDCVNQTAGVVDKYIGDAIMAEWGVPVSKGNDTENAVTASLMMREKLLKFNSNRGGDRKPIIQIGCGINTGPVLAGQIGSEDRMEYTVIGDAVNLASRIESLNKPFGTDILISEDSYKLVEGTFAVEIMSPIKVKGKEEPQQIYAVLGRLDDVNRPKSLSELRKLIGVDMSNVTGEAEEEIKYEILE